jgi:uncharacterized pyridoxal phosphate-dependent enzyme
MKLTEVINVCGTFTPLGVSRASPAVCDAVSEALSSYFIIEELQELASRKIAEFSGAEAASVTHCSAASITISIAALMAGDAPDRIASLPDTTGMCDRVVIPAGHCVNYGHSILQAIRLAGATPVLAGSSQKCSLEDIEEQVKRNNTCGLLLVSSKLVMNDPFDFLGAVEVARKLNVPTIIDGAAQDFRIHELLETGADLVLVSAQKYLSSPTAGLVIGRQHAVEAVRAQEKGIGRGMKASKEAIIGALCAIEERSRLDMVHWQKMQNAKTEAFVQRANEINGVFAASEIDPTGLPFSRAVLSIDADFTHLDAVSLAAELKSGTPSIWVIDDKAVQGQLGFELVQTTYDEIDAIFDKIAELL